MKSLPNPNERQHFKAVQDAYFYTLEELKKFERLSSLGFMCATVAGWLILNFFISAFFAGDEWEHIAHWQAIQYVYALLGMTLASAIIFGQMVLFNSGRTKEYWYVAVLTVCFCIFAETASSMQREQLAVGNKSKQSPTYQAALKSAQNLAYSPTLSAQQISLSYAQADLETAKKSGNTEAINIQQSKVNRLERMVELENQSKSALLSTTLDTAKKWEYDENQHMAVIKLLIKWFSISAVEASAFFAFFLVLTYQAAFHFLGSINHRTKRSIAIAEGDIPVQMVNPLLGHHCH